MPRRHGHITFIEPVHIRVGGESNRMIPLTRAILLLQWSVGHEIT